MMRGAFEKQCSGGVRSLVESNDDRNNGMASVMVDGAADVYFRAKSDSDTRRALIESVLTRSMKFVEEVTTMCRLEESVTQCDLMRVLDGFQVIASI
jgi:hypothetical protein